MGVENPEKPSYQPISWQNHGRRLTHQEYWQMESRLAGLHFSKEGFIDDPIAAQLFYLAEAAIRELRELYETDPPQPERSLD